MSAINYDEEWCKVLENFIGYGDPEKADYFFFGLEEKADKDGSLYCTENLSHKNKTVYDEIDKSKFEFYKEAQIKSTQKTYCIDTKILYDLIPEAKNHDDDKNRTLINIAKLYNKLSNQNIQPSSIGSSVHKLFNGNIFPFPKEKHEDQEALSNSRKELLHSFFYDKILNSNKTVIVFGKIDEAREILKPILVEYKCSTQVYKFKTGKDRGKVFKYYFYEKGVNKICILRHLSNYSYAEILEKTISFCK